MECGRHWWLPGKESACSAGDPDLIPGSERSPGGGKSYSLQYSCLENSTDRGAWQGYSPRSHEELDMTERLTLSLVVQCLRLHASTARGLGLIPGQGTKIPHPTFHVV